MERLPASGGGERERQGWSRLPHHPGESQWAAHRSTIVPAALMVMYQIAHDCTGSEAGPTPEIEARSGTPTFHTSTSRFTSLISVSNTDHNDS
jgi:hypothetical protein